MPNRWDAGSAAIPQNLGFPAIASSSAGFAWTQARAEDNFTRNGSTRDPVHAIALTLSPCQTVGQRDTELDLHHRIALRRRLFQPPEPGFGIRLDPDTN